MDQTMYGTRYEMYRSRFISNAKYQTRYINKVLNVVYRIRYQLMCIECEVSNEMYGKILQLFGLVFDRDVLLDSVYFDTQLIQVNIHLLPSRMILNF